MAWYSDCALAFRINARLSAPSVSEQNAWIASGQTTCTADVGLNFSERALIHRRDRKSRIQVIREVERFATHLNRLSFRDAERPRDGQIQLDKARSLHGVSRHVAYGTHRRNDERLRIEPSIHALVIQIGAHAGDLIGSLVSSALAVKKVVRPYINGEIGSRFDLQDWGELPVARKQPQHIVREPWRLRYRGESQHVTLIRALLTSVIACSTVKAAVARSHGRHAVVSGIAIPQIADAV